MSLDRKTLEAVLGLQPVATIYGDCIEVKKIQALLKGLTEAGEAIMVDGKRVMVAPLGTLHLENQYHAAECNSFPACTVADPKDPRTIAWVARQRKDSHAG